MSEKPRRIQRKRIKGWKMPPNTVYVGRPSKWGNPWIPTSDSLREECVEHFRQWANGYGNKRNKPFNVLELRGKNLACFCPLDQPCHADVLLELANKDTTP